jgi:carbon monoxide dehydrogenase subunit G
MDLSGKYEIPASAREVWDGLNDPQILAACVPGCDSLEKTGPSDFVATATLKIGPMKATFKGTLTLSDLDPPRRCVVRGEGKGGAAGFAKGEAEVLLSEKGGITTLAYTAKATIGGKLAQIGQRLIDGAARQIADEFFGRFARVLTEGKAASEMAASGETVATGSVRGELPQRKRSFVKVWIGVGAAAAAAAVAFLFARRR